MMQRIDIVQESFLARARAAGLVREGVDSVAFQTGLAVVTRPLTELPQNPCAGTATWLVDLYLRGLRPDG